MMDLDLNLNLGEDDTKENVPSQSNDVPDVPFVDEKVLIKSLLSQFN